MGYQEILACKAIAKKLKSRGLGKQHLYCQVCRKQCRDDNGYKCHIESEKHRARIELIADNPQPFIERCSGEFERAYMAIVKTGFCNQWVPATTVYHDYIRQRHQTRLNGTKWVTLDEFIAYLGKEGKLKVEYKGQEKGYYIYYSTEKESKFQETADKLKKREKADLDDEERIRQEIEKRIQIAQATAKPADTPAPTELDEEKKKEMKISLSLAPAKPNLMKKVKMEDETPKETVKTEPADKKRKIDEVETSPKDISEEELKTKKLKRKANWIVPGIVVKILDKKLKGGIYYKMKGVIEQVSQETLAHIKLENGEHVKVEQSQLETVIPQLGKSVKVVNGPYAGATATVKDVNYDKFCVQVLLENGSNAGKVTWEEYEDICKIPEN